MTKEDIEKQIHNLAEYMYKTGYEDGTKYDLEHTKNIIRNHEKCKEVLDAEYERGLNDAWEIAKMIVTGEGELGYDDISSIFNVSVGSIFKKYSASEATQKIKEWEEKQKQELKQAAKRTCKNCKWEDYDMTEQPCIDCGLGIEVWEPKQDEKKCMNCGHMHPHYDTFKCHMIGNCVGREKWIPK